MRIIAPVPIIPRSTGLSPTTLVVNGVSHTIPPDTSVALNPLGLHYNKSYWGPDADTYDPSRWDPSNSSSFLQQFSDPAGEDEKGGGEVMPKLLKPKRCTWIPFSEGYRGCLGKKFAEVEFVAVLTVLLRRKKVSILRLEGETEEMARARAQNLVDSCTNLTALNVNGKIGIVLSDRE